MIFLARIELTPRNPQQVQDEILRLLQLDMWSLSHPETKPEVTVTEEKDE